MQIEGFSDHRIETGEGTIFARVGGSGPPLVCLHGYPQTHLTWRKVAPALAQRYRVVLMDSRGYGASSIVPSDPAHEAYGKRAMARDVVAVMRELGHERFFVAGHDRGARVGYRLALDAPERVAAFASLDVVPTLDSFEMVSMEAAYRAYHWYFLSQPEPLPEKLIGADPDFYCRWTLGAWGGDNAAIEPEALEAYLAWFRSPGAVHVACEDYRAGITCDVEADRADRDAGRRLACPVYALWGAGPLRPQRGDPLDIWRRWADDVSGEALPCGHFLMEEAPAATAEKLLAFFDARHALL